MITRALPNPRVLVLTAPVDPTTDLVLGHLHAQGVPLLRVDTARFPTEMVFSAQISTGRGWRTRLGGVDLDELTIVYYRRPGRFVFDTAIPPEMISWCDGQARYGLWGVLESLPVAWVNAPAQVSQAEYKPRQLAHATAAGLPVPPTLITNDPQRVACFAARQRHGIITKALYARTPRTADGDPSGVLYTTTVPPARRCDPAISSTAHLFQAALSKAHDVRLTVVDGAQFATEIHNPGELDWRRTHQHLTYRACEVPDQIAIGVRALMDRLGLTFGALDFVVTPDGEWIFIEINPNGQWAFIEHATGQPISRALATTLTESRP